MNMRKTFGFIVVFSALLALGACGLRGDNAVPPAKNLLLVAPGSL